jgi:hypothetical protein
MERDKRIKTRGYNSNTKGERRMDNEVKSIIFNEIEFRKPKNERYYKSHSKQGKTYREYLHREIWKFYNGEIPKDCHIHHVDGNRENNSIENLKCTKKTKHLSEHSKQNWKNKEYRNKQITHLDKIRPKTTEWHRSEEGRTWHSIHGQLVWDNMEKVEKICQNCGKTYFTYKSKEKQSKFCNSLCKEKHGRIKRKELQNNTCKS